MHRILCVMIHICITVEPLHVHVGISYFVKVVLPSEFESIDEFFFNCPSHGSHLYCVLYVLEVFHYNSTCILLVLVIIYHIR